MISIDQTTEMARTQARMDWNACQQCINPYKFGSIQALAYAAEYSKIRFAEIFGNG